MVQPWSSHEGTSDGSRSSPAHLLAPERLVCFELFPSSPSRWDTPRRCSKQSCPGDLEEEEWTPVRRRARGACGEQAAAQKVTSHGGVGGASALPLPVRGAALAAPLHHKLRGRPRPGRPPAHLQLATSGPHRQVLHRGEVCSRKAGNESRASAAPAPFITHRASCRRR